MQRHRHQEFIRFLNAVEREVPAGKTVHAILDNYATHKHPKVIEWLGRHPRWSFHFTPTSASWLNAVEGFFAILTKRRLKLRRRSPGRHQSLRRRPQPAAKALRLDRRSRQNHRRRQSWASSVGFNPLADFPPLYLCHPTAEFERAERCWRMERDKTIVALPLALVYRHSQSVTACTPGARRR